MVLDLTLAPSNIIPDSHYPPSEYLLSEPPHLLTPTSLTLVLAYLQYYTPECLPRGRFISPTHLRVLAAWIGEPSPHLRSLRRHPALAAHIALLCAMDFLNYSGDTLIPQPAVSPWLHLPLSNSLQSLLRALTSPKWHKTLEELHLGHVVTELLTVYLEQSLTRQLEAASTVQFESIQWLDTEQTRERWAINLPAKLPDWQHFDLRQLGTWSPGEPLLCTPFTIATAVLRGYSFDLMQWILESAAQEPLPVDRQTQLFQWCRRAHTYQIRTVRLLSTAQPSQITALMRHKRLRQAAIAQITPRHLVVKDEMIEKLTSWLREQGYPLQHDLSPTNNRQPGAFTEYQWYWLCARVLIDLGKLFPLPCPSPYGLLESASQHLSETEISNLEATAATILTSLRQAISGRDAFFPARDPVAPDTINQIYRAIERETPLAIAYQALGDLKASYRQVQPLRLEKRGNLYYLYAYCYRAETNLTFRLDRIKEIL